MNVDSLRVLLICPDFNYRNLRKQPWRHAYELARHLVNHVSEIRIITNKSDESYSDFVIDGIYVHVLQQRTLRFPTKEVATTILAAHFDVVYWFGNPVSGLYIMQYRNLGIPFVLHISQAPFSIKELLRLSHRKIWDYRFDFLSALIPMNWVVRRLNCDPIKAITVSSNAIGMNLVRLGVSPDKVKFAPLSFRHWNITSKTTSEAKDLLRINKQTFVMTYFGGSDTIRGTDVVVKSALSLKNKGVSDFLTIMLLRRETNIADKDELRLRRFVKKHKLEDNIKIISKILSKEELALYLFASDLVVLPFKVVPSEPPLGVLEALSLGKTVVTTDVGSLPELVDLDRGALVKPADVKDLVKVIRELMKSPETRVKLGRQAKNFASKIGGFEDLAKWAMFELSEAVSS
jgi:phosphatidylinositol alpha-1,6-mannosyltransferase